MTDEPEYEWYPEKSAWNERERGFGFELVYAFDFENALVVADERKDYDEPRFRAVGRIDGRPYMVVFTPRGKRLRIISMRRMHEKEARKYGI